ncbi:MAG: putative secreted protein [Candidatus Phytoplasma cynodontis]|nr:MAG: putative secreted protein [Candidatus Phytoplasma cynodontis]
MKTERPLLSLIFLGSLFLICFITYLRQVLYIQNFWHLITRTFYFFTSQSNFLVIIVLLLNFTPFQKNKYYPLVAFIALIDILLTGIVWNLIASPRNELLEIRQDFFTISLFRHLYIPVLYVFFFFSPALVPLHPFFTLKQASLAVIHPLFYLFYSLILAYGSQEKLYAYPYNFMNPNTKCNLSSLFLRFLPLDYYQQRQGFLGVFINNVVLFLCLILFIPVLYAGYRKINASNY